MRWLIAVALVAWLSGCASLPQPAEPVTRPGIGVPWTLQGRIAVKSETNSLSGQLRWQHAQQRDELLLASPLGQGIARIVSDTDGVLLDIPQQAPRRAADAETLTRDVLGIALPLAGLRFWIEGRADTARPFTQQQDARGRIAQLHQDGWTIDYLQYRESPAWQPRKLTVTRDALEVRLVVDTWQTH